jgi:hypothetical protein
VAGCEGHRDTSGRSVIIPTKAGPIHVRIASGCAELGQAFELVASQYRARRYDRPGAARYRFTRYHALPGTITLVAVRNGGVCATMSLVPDTSLLGLPMEVIYGTEVAELRREGRRLAEATSLADAGLTLSEFIGVLTEFSRIAVHYHLRQGGDSCVITINPRYRSFYLNVLGFVPVGPRRGHPSVQGHPAEAFLLDVPLMRANAPEMYETIFGEPLAEPIVSPPPWSPESVLHFGWNSMQIDCRTAEILLLSVEALGSRPRWAEDGPAG